MLKKPEPQDDNSALELSMAAVAAALSDNSRVKMLCALMDGRAWSATELSAVAEISASTTSAHLARLLSEQLISCLSQGRHRYYQLAGQEVAALLEMMMGISWQRIPPPQTRAPKQLQMARTCYDHLAGEVAVKIYDFMTAEGWFTAQGNAISPKGQQQFAQLGIVLNSKTRRKICCPCLDWSERRSHLGGEAGAAFFAYCEQQGWLTRVAGYREVNITPKGKLALARYFNVNC